MKVSKNITQILLTLHWLFISFTIVSKILLLTLKALCGLVPELHWNPVPTSAWPEILRQEPVNCSHLTLKDKSKFNSI